MPPGGKSRVMQALLRARAFGQLTNVVSWDPGLQGPRAFRPHYFHTAVLGAFKFLVLSRQVPPQPGSHFLKDGAHSSLLIRPFHGVHPRGYLPLTSQPSFSQAYLLHLSQNFTVPGQRPLHACSEPPRPLPNPSLLSQASSASPLTRISRSSAGPSRCVKLPWKLQLEFWPYDLPVPSTKEAK